MSAEEAVAVVETTQEEKEKVEAPIVEEAAQVEESAVPEKAAAAPAEAEEAPEAAELEGGDSAETESAEESQDAPNGEEVAPAAENGHDKNGNDRKRVISEGGEAEAEAIPEAGDEPALKKKKDDEVSTTEAVEEVAAGAE